MFLGERAGDRGSTGALPAGGEQQRQRRLLRGAVLLAPQSRQVQPAHGRRPVTPLRALRLRGGAELSVDLLPELAQHLVFRRNGAPASDG
ncbi:hypothetical protein ACFV1R_01940 [Streptomyces coelicoflavus]|uniref:hypothetical protein n=1 Tax=Streptomyces coelicoflavus TaxID=285562 RepID=UPI0036A0DA40